MKSASRAIFAFWKKELILLCASPAALVSVLFFLFAAGLPFLFPGIVSGAASFSFRSYAARIPYISVLVIPALTMGLWADERKSGTWRILLSYPVPAAVPVIGKFLAVFSVYILALACAVPVFLVLETAGLAVPDPGATFSAWCALLCFGAACIALGEFFSALAGGPVPAFLLTAAVLLILNFAQLPAQTGLVSGVAAHICAALSFAWHFEAASRGVIDSRDILFYFVPAAAFLLSTSLLVSRWRVNP